MENLKQIPFSQKNILVYVRLKDSPKYEALASLKNFTIAPNLMYAALYPIEKLENVKMYLSEFSELSKRTNTSFQIRSANDRKKVLFQLN